MAPTRPLRISSSIAGAFSVNLSARISGRYTSGDRSREPSLQGPSPDPSQQRQEDRTLHTLPGRVSVNVGGSARGAKQQQLASTINSREEKIALVVGKTLRLQATVLVLS